MLMKKEGRREQDGTSSYNDEECVWCTQAPSGTLPLTRDERAATAAASVAASTTTTDTKTIGPGRKSSCSPEST